MPSIDHRKRDCRKKQQSLTTDIDPSIPDTLIGDERRLVQIILNLLSNASKFTRLKTECAENGCIALEMFSANPEKFDVILMDINMPEMDGMEATRRIRMLETPESTSIPIIAMTTNVLMSRRFIG